MTQRKEKMGICKSVVIATVVAIREVVKNGFLGKLDHSS